MGTVTFVTSMMRADLPSPSSDQVSVFSGTLNRASVATPSNSSEVLLRLIPVTDFDGATQFCGECFKLGVALAFSTMALALSAARVRSLVAFQSVRDLRLDLFKRFQLREGMTSRTSYQT